MSHIEFSGMPDLVKKKKVYLTVNTWFGRPPLRPHIFAGIEVQLLCKSGIQYVFE